MTTAQCSGYRFDFSTDYYTVSFPDVPPLPATHFQTDTFACPPGFYYNTSACVGCPRQTFQPFYNNNTSCTPCQEGFITDGYTGATMCLNCLEIFGHDYCTYLVDFSTGAFDISAYIGYANIVFAAFTLSGAVFLLAFIWTAMREQPAVSTTTKVRIWLILILQVETILCNWGYYLGYMAFFQTALSQFVSTPFQPVQSNVQYFENNFLCAKQSINGYDYHTVRNVFAVNFVYAALVLGFYPFLTLIVGIIKTYGTVALERYPNTMFQVVTFVPVHAFLFIFNLSNIGPVRSYLTEAYFGSKYQFPVFDILSFSDGLELSTILVALPALFLQLYYPQFFHIPPALITTLVFRCAIVLAPMLLNLMQIMSYFLNLYFYLRASAFGSKELSNVERLRLKVSRMSMLNAVFRNVAKSSCDFDDNALQVACSKGALDEVQAFLAVRSYDINKQNYALESALHIAFKRMYIRDNNLIIDQLILNGADLNLRDINGMTPLEGAILHQYNSVDVQEADFIKKLDFIQVDGFIVDPVACEDGPSDVHYNSLGNSASSSSSYHGLQSIVDYFAQKVYPPLAMPTQTRSCGNRRASSFRFHQRAKNGLDNSNPEVGGSNPMLERQSNLLNNASRVYSSSFRARPRSSSVSIQDSLNDVTASSATIADTSNTDTSKNGPNNRNLVEDVSIDYLYSKPDVEKPIVRSLLTLQTSSRVILAALKKKMFGVAAHMIILQGQFSIRNQLRPLPDGSELAKRFVQYILEHSHITEAVLKASNNALWFQLLENDWIDGIIQKDRHSDFIGLDSIDNPQDSEGFLVQILKRFPELCFVVDGRKRKALTTAEASSQQVFEVLKKQTLWLGRFRATSKRAEYVGENNTIFKCQDEDGLQDEEDSGDDRLVAFKVLTHYSHFCNEVSLRNKLKLSKAFIVEIITYSPRNSKDDFDSTEEKFQGKDCASFRESLLVHQNIQTAIMTKDIIQSCYCIVMPYADRNLFDSIKKDGYAGKDFITISRFFCEIARCVEHLHSRGIIHADIKPSNIVTDGIHWKLIDLKAAREIGAYVCSDSSSAFVPPEVVIRNNGECRLVECEERKVKGECSFDMWSLGCVLFHMCSKDNSPLFQGDNYDSLATEHVDGSDSIFVLYCWCDEMKERKLDKVENVLARNLISQLLWKDPTKRCSMGRLFQHPFLSGSTKVARLLGQRPKADVFISYRVESDSPFVSHLYDLLKKRNCTVWWDKMDLKDGEPWEEGFCAGLCSSLIFVCIVSKDGINNQQRYWHNLSFLNENSSCDNVVLEHRMALELQSLGYISKVFPILIGDYEPALTKDHLDVNNTIITNFFGSKGRPNTPDVCVLKIEEKLNHHMNAQALGSPLIRNRTVKSVLDEVLSYQGIVVEGRCKDALELAADKIAEMASQLKRN